MVLWYDFKIVIERKILIMKIQGTSRIRLKRSRLSKWNQSSEFRKIE